MIVLRWGETLSSPDFIWGSAGASPATFGALAENFDLHFSFVISPW